jgi:hypothetical protein
VEELGDPFYTKLYGIVLIMVSISTRVSLRPDLIDNIVDADHLPSIPFSGIARLLQVDRAG